MRQPALHLGACNPPLAQRALSAELTLSLLLPCNVVAYEDDDGGSVVAALDPEAMMAIAGNPALNEIAAEVRARLERAPAALDSQATA